MHAYKKLKAGLEQKIKDDKATVKRKQAKKGEAASDKGAAEGERSALTEDLNATAATLKETKTECRVNNALYAKQDKLRGEELVAIETATQILAGGAVYE